MCCKSDATAGRRLSNATHTPAVDSHAEEPSQEAVSVSLRSAARSNEAPALKPEPSSPSARAEPAEAANLSGDGVDTLAGGASADAEGGAEGAAEGGHQNGRLLYLTLLCHLLVFPALHSLSSRLACGSFCFT